MTYKKVDADRLDNDISTIATAIREKTESNEELTWPNDFSEKIKNIKNTGGPSVQSDWDINDETDPGFIKNKPFYKILGEEVVAIDGVTNEQGQITSSIHLFSIDELSNVTITYDGVVHSNLKGTPYNGLGAPMMYYGVKDLSNSSPEDLPCMVVFSLASCLFYWKDSANALGGHKIKVTYRPARYNKIPDACLEYKTLGRGEIFNSYEDGDLYCDKQDFFAKKNISGYGSHAEGGQTSALGDFSHTEGLNTIAGPYIGHAEGNGSIALGDESHAEGWSKQQKTYLGDYTVTTKNGKNFIFSSNSESQEDLIKKIINKIIIMSNHDGGRKLFYIEGVDPDNNNSILVKPSDPFINGKYSISVLNPIGAMGKASHSEGISTTASGQASHAEGDSTIASGRASHAEGFGTRASGNNSHVEGQYNIIDTDNGIETGTPNNKYVHIVGNGSSKWDTVDGKWQEVITRSNAHTLDWRGNSWYQGNIKVGGTGWDDPTAKEIKPLEQATETELGGVKVKTATAKDTKEIHINSNGLLVTTVELPPYTVADEGKILKIVNGVPTWVAITINPTP